MSDMPKNLRRAAKLRWLLLAVAALLTVVTMVLWWFELTYRGSDAARTFFWGITRTVWTGWALLCCTVFICQRQAERDARAQKQAERNTVRIIEAICEKRVANIADLMEDGGNVRSIDGKR